MSVPTFGERVRYYRNLRGWDQDELARRIGKSVPTISRIEGGTQNVSLGVILALARALEVPASAFFVGTETHEATPDMRMLSARCEEVVETLHHALSKASQLTQTARTLR
jgi:transcriptional regulator with XRE-family HTH domain